MSRVQFLAQTGSSTRSWVWFPGFSFKPSVFSCLYQALPGRHFGVEYGQTWELESELGFAQDRASHSTALPEDAVWVGWSLGGQIALKLANTLTTPPKAVILLASAPRLVHDNADLGGIQQAQLVDLIERLDTEPERALKAFTMLISTDKHTRRYLAEHQYPASQRSQLKRHLTWLGAQDINVNPSIETHARLFANDVLVSPNTEPLLQHEGVNVQMTAGGHAQFVSQPESCIRWLLASSNTPTRSKADVAHQFSRAAHTYEQAGHLQHKTRSQLLALWQQHAPQRTQVLDIGCGTGSAVPYLLRHARKVTGIDLSDGMIEHAKTQIRSEDAAFILADADALPVTNGSCDGIFSNLMLQWSESPLATLEHWLTKLSDDGVLVVSTLLEGTHQELKHAWEQIDHRVHVNAFLTPSNWQQLLHTLTHKHTLHIVANASDTLVEHYDTLPALLKNLKAIGATNVNSGRGRGLGGKKALEQLSQHYPKQPKGLPLTYQVAYCVLKKKG